MGFNEPLKDTIHRFEPDLPLEEALTPPASWYTDPRFTELEKATVFSNHWLFVGRIDELREPGDFFSGTLLGRPFVVIKDELQGIQAFYNVCSHHGSCIVKGSGNVDRLVCPYHGWAYSRSGRLEKAPRAGSVRGARLGSLDLKPIHVRTWRSFVLLHFKKRPEPLPNTLEGLEEVFPPDLFDGLRFVARTSYELGCNWKVFVDNYLDGGYHVPHMHKGLSAQLKLKSYRTRLGDFWSLQSCDASEARDTDREADFKERLGERVYYLWVYPNFMVNRYGKWMDTNTVFPIDENRCRVVFDYYHDGPLTDEARTRALAASDRVQREDMEICDKVSRGLASGAYDQGVYAPKFEAPMYHYHGLLFRDFSESNAKC